MSTCDARKYESNGRQLLIKPAVFFIEKATQANCIARTFIGRQFPLLARLPDSIVCLAGCLDPCTGTCNFVVAFAPKIGAEHLGSLQCCLVVLKLVDSMVSAAYNMMMLSSTCLSTLRFFLLKIKPNSAFFKAQIPHV